MMMPTTKAAITILPAAHYCQADARVLFTQDHDFLRLHAAGTSHPCIVYCAKDMRSNGEIIQGLVLIWEILESAEMANRVEYL
ncbi:MAG: DUF5615 family PIN-like protein [Planctomycetes bacterium]|nr:DUF5615 family PIN-like protein [Planctomycetota bacterium]